MLVVKENQKIKKLIKKENKIYYFKLIYFYYNYICISIVEFSSEIASIIVKRQKNRLTKNQNNVK